MRMVECFGCFLSACDFRFILILTEFTQSASNTLCGEKIDDLGHQCDGLFMNYYTILQDSHRPKHFSVDDFSQVIWMKRSCILLDLLRDTWYIHPSCRRPHFLAAGIILLAVLLTWLMMDTARIFFLPALPLGPTISNKAVFPIVLKSPKTYIFVTRRAKYHALPRFFWSKYLHLSPEMSAATLLVTSLGHP